MQTHLPKEDADVTGNFLDAEAFRTISVGSAWYRSWASARIKSPSCKKWLDLWWDEDMKGAKAGKEVHDALAELSAEAVTGAYCTSALRHPRVRHGRRGSSVL